MNKSIRRLWIIVTLMFFALLVNLTVSYAVRYDDLNRNIRNARVRDAQFGGHRGDILAANTPIATTEATNSRPFENQRTYLNGPLYAPITGFYSYNYGYSKIEEKYNDVLVGEDASQFISRIIQTVSGEQPRGGNIQTTINPSAQQAAWDALAGREGGVIALDYTTGAILAWVSYPSYDPSPLASIDIDSTTSYWDQLQADETKPMNDRATDEIYPPGSTFKLVTAAAALEAGYTPQTMVDTPAQLQLPQSTSVLPNATACGDTQQTMEFALKMSCNTTFANIAMDIGEDKIVEQAEKFGFNSSFGGDIDSAASNYPTGMSQAQLAMSGIGQFDVAATPLQMAVVAGAIANGGLVMNPYVVSETRDSSERVISSTEPSEYGQAMSAENAKMLSEMMQLVVTQGTGTQAQIPGEVVGGKTGTAENAAGAQAYSWFAGYMESSHIAVAVFLKEPGNSTATPVARQVMEALR